MASIAILLVSIMNPRKFQNLHIQSPCHWLFLALKQDRKNILAGSYFVQFLLTLRFYFFEEICHIFLTWEELPIRGLYSQSIDFFNEATTFSKRLTKAQTALWIRDFPYCILYREICICLPTSIWNYHRPKFRVFQPIVIVSNICVGNSRTILLIARLADSTNIATFVGIVIFLPGSWKHRLIDFTCSSQYMFDVTNSTLFGLWYSSSREFPNIVRLCFVGISGPLSGSYFFVGAYFHQLFWISRFL